MQKTSLYTTLKVLSVGCPLSSRSRIFRPSCYRTRDIATYSWPCVKTGCGRYNPTWSKLWPWLLLMVIAKDRITGNCLLHRVKGKEESEGVMLRRGIKTCILIWVPVMISAPMTCFSKRVIMSLVPLHSQMDLSMLRMSITGTPTLSLMMWLGSPDIVFVFKNSIVWSFAMNWMPLLVLKHYLHWDRLLLHLVFLIECNYWLYLK